MQSHNELMCCLRPLGASKRMATLPFPRDALGRVYEEAAKCGTLSLAPIAESVRGSYGLFFGANAAGGGVDEAFCHGVDRGYVHRLKQASDERLLPPWLDELAPGSVFDRASFGSDQAFGRTAFFNHVIRPEGRFHCMIATPYVSKRQRFHLIVGRPRHKAEFDTDDRRLLQALLPHVGEVIRLREELAEAKASARRAECVLDGLPMQMIIVSADATITFATIEAQRSLSLRDGIHVDAKGRISTSTLLDTSILRQAIATVAMAHDAAPLSLDLPRLSGGVPIRIAVSPVEQSADGRGDEGVAMITIERHDRSGGRDHATAIARAHGLTRREADLATLLARGRSLPDASRDLGMSYNTARSYLRQTFGKLDIHRQSDLVRLFTTGLRPEEAIGSATVR